MALKLMNYMIVNDSKAITSKFNEFFCSVANEIDKKIHKSKITYTDYLKKKLKFTSAKPCHRKRN